MGASATVRLFAAARAAADGTSEVQVEPGPLGTITADLADQFPGLASVLPHCSLVIDGVRGDAQTIVMGGATIDVLPPFAGG